MEGAACSLLATGCFGAQIIVPGWLAGCSRHTRGASCAWCLAVQHARSMNSTQQSRKCSQSKAVQVSSNKVQKTTPAALAHPPSLWDLVMQPHSAPAHDVAATHPVGCAIPAV